jgi:hypothetical protein
MSSLAPGARNSNPYPLPRSSRKQRVAPIAEPRALEKDHEKPSRNRMSRWQLRRPAGDPQNENYACKRITSSSGD